MAQPEQRGCAPSGAAWPTWNHNEHPGAGVATEQFVGPLAGERDLDVLAGALADEIHRYDRRRGDRLFEAQETIVAAPFRSSGGPAGLQCVKSAPKRSRRFGRVDKLVVLETRP